MNVIMSDLKAHGPQATAIMGAAYPPSLMRADAMLEKGDLDGYAVWKRILRAVEELQGTEPKSGEAVH